MREYKDRKKRALVKAALEEAREKEFKVPSDYYTRQGDYIFVDSVEELYDYAIKPRVVITPALAEELLKRKGRTRHLREYNIGRLAHAIEKGDWKVNANGPICISEDGKDDEKQVDGNHRLEAIIRTGISLPVILQYVSDDGIEVVDTNLSRTIGDTTFRLNEELNHKEATALSAALALMNSYSKIVAAKERGKSIKMVRRGHLNLEIKALNEKYSDMIESCRFIFKCIGNRRVNGLKPDLYMPIGSIIFLHYITSKHDPDKAKLFWKLYIDKEAKELSYIGALRTRIEKEGNDIPPTAKLALFIRTYNLFISDEDFMGAGRIRWGDKWPFPIVGEKPPRTPESYKKAKQALVFYED